MTTRTLRHHLGRIGQTALAVGVLLAVRGLLLGNTTMAAVGGLLLFGGGYAAVYARAGSF